MLIYTHQVLSTTIGAGESTYSSPELWAELARADTLIVEWSASMLDEGAAATDVFVWFEESSNGNVWDLGAGFTSASLSPGGTTSIIDATSGINKVNARYVRFGGNLGTGVMCQIKVWVTGRARERRRSKVSLYAPQPKVDSLIVAPDGSSPMKGYDKPKITRISRSLPGMRSRIGARLPANLPMIGSSFGAGGGREIVTYGDGRRVIPGLPPPGSFRSDDLERLAGIHAESRGMAAVIAAALAEIGFKRQEGGATHEGGGFFQDWSVGGPSVFDVPDYSAGNRGPSEQAEWDEQHRVVGWGDELFGDPEHQDSNDSLGLGRWDLVGDTPSTPRSYTADELVKMAVERARAELERMRALTPSGERHRSMVTGDQMTNPSDPVTPVTPAPPPDGDNDNDIGPDGVPGWMAAFSAALIRRVPLLRYATRTRSRSNVGPQINPGPDPGSGVDGGQGSGFWVPKADEPFNRWARRPAGRAMRRPVPIDGGWFGPGRFSR